MRVIYLTLSPFKYRSAIIQFRCIVFASVDINNHIKNNCTKIDTTTILVCIDKAYLLNTNAEMIAKRDFWFR